jgi:hypothetical protein
MNTPSTGVSTATRIQHHCIACPARWVCDGEYCCDGEVPQLCEECCDAKFSMSAAAEDRLSCGV